MPPLLFVSLVPLFYALDGRRRFLHGLIFGATFFALDQRWVLTVFRFSPLVVPGFLLLILYLGLFFALPACFLQRESNRPFGASLLLAAPALFTLFEFARAQGPLGTGFSGLYHAFYKVPWLIQSAALSGPWTITALVILVNAALYLALRRKRAGYAVVAIAGVALLAAPALLRIAPDDGPALRAAVVSSNVNQEYKLDARNLKALTDRYEALGRKALSEDPDLVVFPESILPSFILDNEDAFRRLARLAVDGEMRVLFGTGVYERPEIRNEIVLLSIEGEILGAYAMVRPVPFGEYIPGRRIWESIGLKGLMDSFLPVDLTAGEAFAPLDGIGTPICFESMFPGPARGFVRDGATILAVVTNDAWFIGSSELNAHFSAAIFRAVESRRYVLQSANGGVSGIVDPRGRIVTSTTSEDVIVTQIRERRGLTLYARVGDAPLMILLALCAVVYAAIEVRRKREVRAVETRNGG